MSIADIPCFGMHASKITQILIDLPCGVPNSTNPHVTCCVNGDYCLSNSLCTHISPDGSQNYYNADCTDPTLEDPICGARCGGKGLSDLVYNETTGFWACCWNEDTNQVECKNPSNEIYPAPAPSELATIQYLPKTESGTPTYATTTATATASVSGTTSANATITETNIAVNSPSSPAKSSSGVGAGAAAGIGVGVGVAVVIIAAGVLFIVFRRKVSKRGSSMPYDGHIGSARDHQQADLKTLSLQGNGVTSQPAHELDDDSTRIAELDIRRYVGTMLAVLEELP